MIKFVHIRIEGSSLFSFPGDFPKWGQKRWSNQDWINSNVEIRRNSIIRNHTRIQMYLLVSFKRRWFYSLNDQILIGSTSMIQSWLELELNSPGILMNVILNHQPLQDGIKIAISSGYLLDCDILFESTTNSTPKLKKDICIVTINLRGLILWPNVQHRKSHQESQKQFNWAIKH